MGKLIDAEKLIEYIDAGHFRNPNELCFSEMDVVNMLLHAPTAYDVDAVVEQAMKELLQYRKIGTVEECREAMEKQVIRKPICIDKCTCPSCATQNEAWKKRRNTVYSDVVYCWHCGQAVEILRSDK